MKIADLALVKDLEQAEAGGEIKVAVTALADFVFVPNVVKKCPISEE